MRWRFPVNDLIYVSEEYPVPLKSSKRPRVHRIEELSRLCAMLVELADEELQRHHTRSIQMLVLVVKQR